jgi:hypothetical protein
MLVRGVSAVTLVTILGACAPGRAGPGQSPDETHAEARVERGVGHEQPPPPMPRPGRGRTTEAVLVNQSCEACHEDVAREWRGSLHQRANLEPAYRRAFDIEPLPFCRACHAPEAIPTEAESEEVSELGVGCVTCHLSDDGAVLAAGPGPGLASDAPHPIVRSAAFAASDACATCHEFRFPTEVGRRPEHFMQHTVTEHASSRDRDRPCADCHMPADGRRRHHRFTASRDEGMVRSAVEVRAERASPTAARVTLIPHRPGHAFPTGDLFRRVEIVVEALGPDTLVLSESRQILARHWRLRDGGVGRTLVRDDRLRDEPRELLLDVGPAGIGRPLAFRVAYQRVAHPGLIDDGDTVVEGEIVLAAGVLAPAGAR